MKTLRVAFTGHRPNKLGGYDLNNPLNRKIIQEIRNIVCDLLNDDKYYNYHFITGGAIGVDQIAYGIVNIYKICNNITQEIAIPFKKQPDKWTSQKDICAYYHQIESADKVTYVDELPEYNTHTTPIGEFSVMKAHIRNHYMVDNCDILIAVWDGSPSGTKNCIDYAKKLGKKIIYIRVDKLRRNL